MGCDWACFGNDERLGLAIGNFANEMTALYVSDQPASLQFSDLANLYGLGRPTQPPLKFGLFFFDYDLDGRLDLMSANGHLEPDIAKVQASETYEQPVQLFWNTGQDGPNLFTLVGPDTAGPDLFGPIVGRGSAYADIDGDGDLDVVIAVNNGPARLFRNDGGNANHWIRLALHGNGKTSNRDAIGAKVMVKVGDQDMPPPALPGQELPVLGRVPADLRPGEGREGDEVTITWPSGKVHDAEGSPGQSLIRDRRGRRIALGGVMAAHAPPLGSGAIDPVWTGGSTSTPSKRATSRILKRSPGSQRNTDRAQGDEGSTPDA